MTPQAYAAISNGLGEVLREVERKAKQRTAPTIKAHHLAPLLRRADRLLDALDGIPADLRVELASHGVNVASHLERMREAVADGWRAVRPHLN